jgi:hypothetical protein
MDRLKRGGRLSKREYAWKWSASIKVRAQMRRQVYSVVRLQGRATPKCAHHHPLTCARMQHLLSNKDHLEIEHAAVLALIQGDHSAFSFSPACPLLGNATRCGPVDMEVLRGLCALYVSPQLTSFFEEAEAHGLKEPFRLRRRLWSHLVAQAAARDEVEPRTRRRRMHAANSSVFKVGTKGGRPAGRRRKGGVDPGAQVLEVERHYKCSECQVSTRVQRCTECRGRAEASGLPLLHVRIKGQQRQRALQALRRVEQHHNFVPAGSAVPFRSAPPHPCTYPGVNSRTPSPAVEMAQGRPVADDEGMPTCAVHEGTPASWGVPDAAGESPAGDDVHACYARSLAGATRK